MIPIWNYEEKNLPLISLCREHTFVLVVCPDPHPNEIFALLNRKSPVVEPSSYWPKLTHFLEMKGRMQRVSFQKLKVLLRYLSNRFRKPLEASPKPVCCPMHLEFLEPSFGFFLHRFLDQEIQPSRLWVYLNFFVPVLPVPFQKPSPQATVFLFWEGLNRRLDFL